MARSLRILVPLALTLALAACGDASDIRPPDWILGTWQANYPSNASNRWEFSSKNAVFKQTVNGRTETFDFADTPGVNDEATDTTYTLRWKFQGQDAVDRFTRVPSNPNQLGHSGLSGSETLNRVP